MTGGVREGGGVEQERGVYAGGVSGVRADPQQGSSFWGSGVATPDPEG